MREFYKTWIGVAAIGTATATVYFVDGPIGGLGFMGILLGWFARSLTSDWTFPKA